MHPVLQTLVAAGELGGGWGGEKGGGNEMQKQ